MTDTSEQEPATRGRIRGFIARITSPPRWWPLPVGVLIGFLCGSAYGVLAPAEYAATSYVVAVPAKESETQPGAALGLAQAYGRIATSDATLAYARSAAGVSSRVLRDRVRAETSPDSPMIAITGTARRPGRAADIANAVADAIFVSGNQVAKNTGVRLLSFSPAIPPKRPASPSARISAAVGASTGGLLGGLVLLARPRRGQRATGAAVPAPAGAPDSAKRGRV